MTGNTDDVLLVPSATSKDDLQIATSPKARDGQSVRDIIEG